MKEIICFLNNFLMTDTIDNLAKKEKIFNGFFLGTYPADIIPYNGKKTCCWIWNTDKQNESGTHWIAIWIDNNIMYFFDSFGFNIKKYKRVNIWEKFAKENKLIIKYHHYGFYQNLLTKTCGVWSLIFLYEKCYNKKNKNKIFFLEKSINCYQKDKDKKKIMKGTINNEIVLFIFAKKIFGKQLIDFYKKQCKTKKPTDQICKNFISSKIN